ncbi:MAG: hypothetical protein P9M14_16425 [Candidatus Alcyoniella australis]|nr:hypothetical protein [Candidatus Alcyoniella australis]
MSEDKTQDMQGIDVGEKCYLDHRKVLVEGEAEQCTLFDKTVIYLAGGAFGISLLFLGNIAQTNIFYKWSLITSWVCLGVSISCTLFSFKTSELSFRYERKNLDQTYKRGKDSGASCNRWTLLTDIFNWFSAIGLIAGLVFLSVFCIINLN